MFNLLIAKERVNKFIQDSEEVESSAIAENFGVNEDMLQAAIQMTKEKSDGKTRSVISWGESVVSDGKARAET